MRAKAKVMTRPMEPQKVANTPAIYPLRGPSMSHNEQRNTMKAKTADITDRTEETRPGGRDQAFVSA